MTPQTRILVALEAPDFRCGIDGLAKVCRARLGADPFAGALFVFRNRRATSVKLLAYDGQGFWLAQKRLSAGKFRFWPSSSSADASTTTLKAHELHVLLFGGDPTGTRAAPAWRPLSP